MIITQCAIGTLTKGMSTKTVARESNVNFSTISCRQCRFREFRSTSNRPHNHASSGPSHSAFSPVGSSQGVGY
ncbi:unnamed protein product [Oncorhynchus mykiss]|uniref:Uncharacterized protein n=1 Tax=Oncorhynchus mykiss TaxID=8022 RepID=A0A060VUJ6_ONCMY|nr:unnamed protein product [Oncorhynchus mykiss]